MGRTDTDLFAWVSGLDAGRVVMGCMDCEEERGAELTTKTGGRRMLRPIKPLALIRHFSHVLWIWVMLLLVPCLLNAASKTEDFSLSKLGVAGEILGLIPADLDRDSLVDIVVFHKKGLPPQETRWVSVFWQSANGTYGTAPA